MKKSNKLLLGGLVMVILIIAGIHIALYAKYKSGDYTLYHRAEIFTDNEFQPFMNVKSVKIQNVFSATIQFGDVATVERSKGGEIQYEQKGDTLLVTGHYLSKVQPDPRAQLTITVPDDATIITDSISRITLFTKGVLKTKITTTTNTP